MLNLLPPIHFPINLRELFAPVPRNIFNSTAIAPEAELDYTEEWFDDVCVRTPIQKETK